MSRTVRHSSLESHPPDSVPWVPPLKIQIPTLKQLLLSRKQISALDAAFEHKLTLIQAPAGYGKTTLLAQWSQDYPRQIAWLSLDHSDNFPHTFLNGVIQSLSKLHGEEWELKDQFCSLEPYTLQQLLLEQWSRYTCPVCLVLDDYHLIQNPLIGELLSTWLTYLPPVMHLVLASRSEPLTLPLLKLKAQDQLFQFSVQDLRLDLTETQIFFNLRGLKLKTQDIKTIYAFSEGWLLSLQLLSFHLKQNSAGELDTYLQGAGKDIAEFLLSEIVENLSETEQSFLTTTSILESLNLPLCQTLSGQVDAENFLTGLLQKGLPFSVYSPETKQYAYHPRLKELLQIRLKQKDPQAFFRLHTQAAMAYAASSQLELALYHGLAGKAWPQVSELLQAHTANLLSQGNLSQLMFWYEQIPEDILLNEIDLIYHKIRLHSFLNHDRDISKLLHAFETKAGSTMALQHQLKKTVLDTIWAAKNKDLKKLKALADKILTSPEADSEMRLIAAISLAYFYEKEQDLNQVLSLYAQAQKLCFQEKNWFYYIRVLISLTLVNMNSGALYQAEHDIQAFFDLFESKTYHYQPSVGMLYTMMAHIYFLWSEHEKMEVCIKKSLKTAHYMHPEDRLAFYIYRSALVLYLDAGQIEKAKEHHQVIQARFKPVLAEGFGSKLSTLNLIYEAYICLIEDRSSGFLVFKRLEHNYSINKDSLTKELSLALLSKWYISQKEVEKALNLVINFEKEVYPDLFQTENPLEILKSSQNHLVYLSYAEFLMDKILVLYHAGQKQIAIQHMAALFTSASEGHLGGLWVKFKAFSFLNLKIILKESLNYLVESGHDLPHSFLEYLGKILQEPDYFCFSSPILSEREKEILRLMAQNIQNKSIAQKLFISDNTLKTHIRHIFSKLSVRNRFEALEKYREIIHR